MIEQTNKPVSCSWNTAEVTLVWSLATKYSALPLCIVRTCFSLPLAVNFFDSQSFLIPYGPPPPPTPYTHTYHTPITIRKPTNNHVLFSSLSVCPDSTFSFNRRRQSWRWMWVEFPGLVTLNCVLTCGVCRNETTTFWQWAAWEDSLYVSLSISLH